MNQNSHSLKCKIKLWEAEFAKTHQRKPSKADIKGSEIEDTYLAYWHSKSEVIKTKETDGDVWSLKYNKSAQKSSRPHQNGPNPNGKFHSSFTNKLWRSSLEMAQNVQNLKSTVSNHPKKKEAVIISDSSVNVSGGTAEVQKASETANSVGNSEKQSAERDPYTPEWKPSYSNTKFTFKTYTRGNRSSSVHLKSAEVDVKWLEKCMTDPQMSDECGDLDNPSNTVHSNDEGSETVAKQTEVIRATSFAETENVLVENGNRSGMPVLKTVTDDVNGLSGNVTSEVCSSTDVPNSEFLQDECTGFGNSDMLNKSERVQRNQENFFEEDSLVHKNKSIRRKPVVSSEPSRTGTVENPENVAEVNRALSNPNEVNSENGSKKKSSRKRKVLSEADDLDTTEKFTEHKTKKMKSESSTPRLVSENFVKLNIKQKKFTRGPNRLKGRQLKQKMWKKKKWASSGGKCFSCGQSGHWAANCPKKNESLLNEEAFSEVKKVSEVNEEAASVELGSDKKMGSQKEPLPIFDEEYITKRIPEYLKKFKHKKFRPFQENAISRILSGQSTLLVLPTGSGKSLCYQIPACIYAENSRCISLVISPLVSLMDDQIRNHPSFLSSVSLHSGLTSAQRQHTLDRLKSGDAKVLLIAPESLLAMHTFFKSALPTIAFACIDEAHCLSEWSHNFRPAYLQVLKILKTSLNVGCILGLSATVTKGTINRICCLMDMDQDDAVLGETFIPSNLLLSVSREKDKERALLELLGCPRFHSLKSVIVYCTRRETTERLASAIRIHFQNVSRSKENGIGSDDLSVAAYHAGLTAAQRRTTQKNFMKGKLNIVVATVAFGMGLNKADVRSVIHYDLPKSFESYVQEIGRAGRDGQPAYCHLFLQPQANDLHELRRHIYANSTDRAAVRKLLNRIFQPQAVFTGRTDTEVSYPREIAIPIDDIVQELDVNKEIIETLLCYLELHPGKWFEVLPVLNNSCSIKCYGGPEQLNKLIQNCKAVSTALQLASTVKTTSEVTFNLVEICSNMGWDFELVRKELRNLQFASVNGSWRRTGLLVEFGSPSFHIRILKEFSSEQKDQLLNFLHDISTQQEKKELRKLHSLFKAFKSYSRPSFIPDEEELERSDGLKSVLCDYFRDSHVSSQEEVPTQSYSEDELRKEVRSFLDIYHEQRFNAMQVARIFYGIGSPLYPAEVWGKVRRFWRSFIYIEFPDIVSAARQELIRLRS